MKTWITRFAYNAFLGRPRAGAKAIPPPLECMKRILVVRDDHIGDLICSTPVFEALRSACPEAELVLAASTYNAEIVKGNPFIDEVICYRKHKHTGGNRRLESTWEQYRFLRCLRKRRFDLAIGLKSQFGKRQAQIVFASGAPYRVGYGPHQARYRHFAFFYNIRISFDPTPRHEVIRTLDILKPFGIEVPCPRPLVIIEDEYREFASRCLLEKRVQGRPVVGYHISNRKPQNRWALESFARVIDGLKTAHPGSEHLLTFAPGDEADARRLASLCSSSTHIVPTERIKELAAVVERCHIFITVDGAPLHLAAALGVPTVAIFGSPLGAACWHPWGPGHRWFHGAGETESVIPESVLQSALSVLDIRESPSFPSHDHSLGDVR